MIYQLEHTNIALSGQVKLDVFLKWNGSEAEAYKVKVSPVSERVAYGYDINTDDALKSHLYNIKNLKSELGSEMYDTCPEISSNYFLPDNTLYKTYCDQYEAGVHRCSVKKYGKQFNLFCPIWIDSQTDFNDVTFQIIRPSTDLGSQCIPVKFEEHIIKYLNDVYNNSDWAEKIPVMSVWISRREAWIYGIDTNDGRIKKIDISTLTNNLTSRERPLIEQNFMITNQFKANEMITPCLLNVNFIFDSFDLLSKRFADSIYNEEQSFKCSILYKDEEVKMYDFYFNHNTIPQLKFNDSKTLVKTGDTIFNTIKENYVYDLAYTNKYIQTICHWSTAIVNPQFFNLYHDFALVDDKDTKGSILPSMSDFSSTKDTQFNNIFAFATKINDKIATTTSSESLSSSEIVTYLNTRQYVDLRIGDMYGKPLTDYYQSICYDYSFEGNDIPGFGEDYKFLFLLVDAPDDDEDFHSVCCFNKYITVVGTKQWFSELNVFDEFVDEIISFSTISSISTKLKSWFEGIKEANKLTQYTIKASVITKLHNDNTHPELISYDLYADDSAYATIYRKEGEITPFLTTSDSIYYNDFYSYKKLTDTVKSQYNNYWGQHLNPNYVKNDVFFALNCLSRDEYMQLQKTSSVNRPMLNTTEGSVKQLYNVLNYDSEEAGDSYDENNPVDFFVVFKKLTGFDDSEAKLYFDYYEYNVTSLKETFESGIVIYKYKIKFSLK